MAVKIKKHKDEESAEGIAEEYGAYVPSSAVTDAKNYLKQLKSTGYDRKWGDRLDSLVDLYLNREDFSYDPDGDVLWQNVKSNAMRGGRLAMEDTSARLASLSGGYANSYAATAAAQVYEKAISDVMATAPEYYEAAYRLYRDEGDALLDNIAMLQKLDEGEYSRYTDSVSAAEDAYDAEYRRDHDLWREAVSDARYEDELSYDRRQDELDRAYRAERDAVSDTRYEDELSYDRRQDELDRAYRAERDAVSDARYEDELSYDRRQDELDRAYRAGRDAVSDAQTAARLAEDARQFDEKQKYNDLKDAYDALAKDESERIKAEEQRAEEEEKLASIKNSPKYRNALVLLNVSKDKARLLRDMYDEGDFGNGESAYLYLTLLSKAIGLTPNTVLGS